MSEPGAETELRVGYSPCPNDTFIFHALVSGLVPAPGILWKPVIEDVETLNALAFAREIPVTKISFHAFGHLRKSHALLASGAALGRGCGPLIVARDASVSRRLASSRVAIPGLRTSAALLLRLFEPALPSENVIVMPFDRILDSVESGLADAGLIIHESRFTYAARGLVAVADLGEWWEGESGLPLPLGGIIAERTLGAEVLRGIEDALRRSVAHARRNPGASREYVRKHAQELSEEVTRAHIELYVNDFTEDLGEEGLRAVKALFEAAESRGLVPAYTGPLGI